MFPFPCFFASLYNHIEHVALRVCDKNLNIAAFGRKLCPQMLGEDRQDGHLRAEVPRIDDVHALLDGTLRIVVLHIARDVDIRAEADGIVDKVRARAAADSDAPYGARGSRGKAHMADAEAFLHCAGKVLDARRSRKNADTADALGHAAPDS